MDNEINIKTTHAYPNAIMSQSHTNMVFELDTTNFNLLGSSYLVFDLINLTNDNLSITDLFDELTWTYNGIESNISSEFILLLLDLHTDNQSTPALHKLLKSNPLYLPIPLFFNSNKNSVYVQFQSIKFTIKNVNLSKVKTVKLLYDEILNKNFKNFKETEIPIEVFSMIKIPLVDSHKIQIPNNYLQELIWVYKNDFDKHNKYFHPVKSIGLNLIMNTQKNVLFFTERENTYFRYVTKYIAHTNSDNNNIYVYPFVLYPEIFTTELTISEQCKFVELVNIFDPDTTIDFDNKYIHICIKSFCFVDLILGCNYQPYNNHI